MCMSMHMQMQKDKHINHISSPSYSAVGAQHAAAARYIHCTVKLKNTCSNKHCPILEPLDGSCRQLSAQLCWCSCSDSVTDKL